MAIPASDERARQEAEYEFPYHYIPEYEEGFRSHRLWWWGYQYAATLRYLKEVLADLTFDSVVDIGCGDGRLTREIRRWHPEVDLMGVDVSSRAIRMARAMNPAIRFEVEDLAEAELPSRFDLATMIEVLEHLPPDRLDEAMARTEEIVAPGGHLVVTIPSDQQPVEDKHHRHFSADDLRKLLEPGFEVVDLHHLHAPGAGWTVLEHLLHNRFFVLRFQPLLDAIFDRYYEKAFVSRDGRGDRLFALARRSPGEDTANLQDPPGP